MADPQAQIDTPVVRTDTRVDRLIDALVRRVLRGDFLPGQKLPPERDLAEHMNVSRPTLREALRGLERMGLIASRHGSGTRVLDWRRAGTLELLPYYLESDAALARLPLIIGSGLRLRAVPIVESARWLAAAHEHADFAALERALAAAWEARADAAVFLERDIAFIEAMMVESGFLPGLWLINVFQTMYRRLVEQMGLQPTPEPGYRETWQMVLDLARSGNAEGAAAATADYFERWDQRLLERRGA